MTSRKLDAIYGGTVIAAVFLVYWVSVGGGQPSRSIANDPFWYPQILLGLMAICAAVVSLQAVIGRPTEGVLPVRWARLGVAVLLSTLYMMVYHRIGFVIDTLILIPLMGWFLGFKRPLVLALVSVGFTIAIWYGFHFLLHITPPGPGLPTFAD